MAKQCSITVSEASYVVDDADVRLWAAGNMAPSSEQHEAGFCLLSVCCRPPCFLIRRLRTRLLKSFRKFVWSDTLLCSTCHQTATGLSALPTHHIIVIEIMMVRKKAEGDEKEGHIHQLNSSSFRKSQNTTEIRTHTSTDTHKFAVACLSFFTNVAAIHFDDGSLVVNQHPLDSSQVSDRKPTSYLFREKCVCKNGVLTFRRPMALELNVNLLSFHRGKILWCDRECQLERR